MKSSESRTNSKYKSPYGCRTNSHWELYKLGIFYVLCNFKEFLYLLRQEVKNFYMYIGINMTNEPQ